MRGPNYWSAHQNKLIVLRVRLDDSAMLFEQQSPLLDKNLKEISPLLVYPKNCRNVCELTGNLALQLQSLAGMQNDHLMVPPVPQQPDATGEHCTIIFSYTIENAGLYAAQAAVNVVNGLLNGRHYQIDDDVQQLARINRRESLGPSTQALVDEAFARNIPVTRLDKSSLMMFGQGCRQSMVRAAVASSTSAIAVENAQDKETTKSILEANSIPVPKGLVVTDVNQLMDAVTKLGFPLVVKPLNGNHGRGITTRIMFTEEAIRAFKQAQQISRPVIIERHIEGSDYRFLVINYKLVAVARRTPACVTGDGVSTIQQLVDKENQDPRRGLGHENVLTAITIDAGTLSLLSDHSLTPNSVPAAGRTVYLKDTANLSSGGTADDVTDSVHPQNRFMAERIARLMNLDICGIDIMAASVSEPINNRNGAILEVNAGPGLRMHLAPSSGQPRNVAAPILDMLYPQKAPGRIPLVAVTGTNGKTTTTRLIAHLAKQAGHITGFTSTDGIFINDGQVEHGDCSGPKSAAVVLRDPIVSFAVLECARGGILRSGLGFDKCDVSIVTNITADHLGIDGITTIEELARVKGVVPKSTSINGYAVLNADDDRVYQMKDMLLCNIALFSLSADNPRIRRHIKEGKLAAFVDDGHFIISKGKRRYTIAEVAKVPLTFEGTAECMIKNILPSILAAFISNFPVKVIESGLSAFKPSPEFTPGRMNLFEFSHCRLLLDYAHNEGGYQELKAYASKINASTRIAVIAATGDRREEDIRNLGALVGEIFDHVIIRHDKDGRGRSNEQLTKLITEGVRRTRPDMPIEVVSDEFKAIEYALAKAPKDAWIFANCDSVQDTVNYVAELHRQDQFQQNNKPVLV